MSILGKIFKQKLDQRLFDFKEEYWNALEKKLDANSGKSGTNHFGLFSFSVVLIALVGAAIWFFSSDREKNNVSIATPSRIFAGKTFSELNKNENKLSVQISGNINSNREKSVENIISSTAKESISSIQKFDLNIDKNNYSSSELVATNDFFAQKNIFSKQVISTKTQSRIFAGQTLSGLSSASEKNENQKILVEEISFENKTESPADLTASETRLIFSLMQKINLTELPVISRNEIQNQLFSQGKGRRKNNYFIGAYSGIMYTDKILKSNDANLTEYISRRKKEESPALTQNFGIDFGIAQNRWSISTGISFHQQGEILNYKAEFYQWLKNSSSSWSIQDNSSWNIDTVNTVSVIVANGNWQTANTVLGTDTITINQYVVDTQYTQTFYITDSNYVQQFDSTEIVKIDSVNKLVNDVSSKPQKSSSKISYFEIPIMFGYEFPISRFTLMLKTGFSVGMLSKVTAKYLKNDISGTEEIELSRMNKTMLNYMLRPSVCFYLTENTLLNVEPFFRTNINSIFKSENFTQKYWNAGINMGVMYRF